MHILAMLDYETGERAGAGGFFQVARLEAEDSNDPTSKVDVGHHFEILIELEEVLTRYLAKPRRLKNSKPK